MTNKCWQCGKELTTGDGVNEALCHECKQKALPSLQGWICPRCGKVNSPFVVECDCGPQVITTTSGDTSFSCQCKG